MRKTIIVEKEESVLFCDICGKKIKTYTSCMICNRELCENCSKDMKHTSSMWYPPCPVCLKFSKKYFEDIKKCFEKQEEFQKKGMDLMNKWGKESTQK